MDEKKFEEAVRLRGRYFNADFGFALILVETKGLFSSFVQEL